METSGAQIEDAEGSGVLDRERMRSRHLHKGEIDF